jgi:hypothetical protein
VVSAHDLFKNTLEQNNKEQNDNKPFCQVQKHKTGNNYPQTQVGKKAA